MVSLLCVSQFLKGEARLLIEALSVLKTSKRFFRCIPEIWPVGFLFSFTSKYFLIPFVILSLTLWLHKSVWFNFQVLVNFPSFLSLLIFINSTVAREPVMNYYNPLKCITHELEKNVHSASVG